jgi:guanylate kinase
LILFECVLYDFRVGEENGVHYHFVEMEKMEEAVSKGEFLEHARVHANMYGTSAKAVEEVTVTS